MLRINIIMNLKRVIFAVIVILFSSSNTYCATLKVGASFAPPYYTVKDKNVTGILAELMTKVVSDAGYSIEWAPAPTKRLYDNLINGNIDVYLGPEKPSLTGFNESVLKSTSSPVTLELRSYYFGDKPPITKKEQLSGHKVLIIRGYTYGGFVNYILAPENNIKYYEVASFDQAIKMLKSRGFDYHLDYRKTGEIYLENHTEPNLKYSTLFSVKLYIMVSKNTLGADNILHQLENAFLKIKE